MPNPTPEELSKYMAIHLFNAGEFDEENELVLFCKGMSFHDDKELICYEDWQPHLDKNLSQTYQCVKEFIKNEEHIFEHYYDGSNHVIQIKYVLYDAGMPVHSVHESLAIAILTAIWRALEGVEADD